MSVSTNSSSGAALGCDAAAAATGSVSMCHLPEGCAVRGWSAQGVPPCTEPWSTTLDQDERKKMVTEAAALEVGPGEGAGGASVATAARGRWAPILRLRLLLSRLHGAGTGALLLLEEWRRGAIHRDPRDEQTRGVGVLLSGPHARCRRERRMCSCIASATLGAQRALAKQDRVVSFSCPLPRGCLRELLAAQYSPGSPCCTSPLRLLLRASGSYPSACGTTAQNGYGGLPHQDHVGMGQDHLLVNRTPLTCT